MARDVAGLVAGMALLEPGFTVTAGLPAAGRPGGRGADPAIDAAVDAALAATGWPVDPVELAGLDAATSAAMTVLDAEAWASDGGAGRVRPGPDRPGRAGPAAPGQGTITGAALGAAWQQAAVWRATVTALWEQVDLLALPTLLGFPPALDHSRDMVQIRGVTSAVNLAGVPALALPVPTGGPLPASIQLIGPAGGRGPAAGRGRRPGAGGAELTRPGQAARLRTVIVADQLPELPVKLFPLTPRYSSPPVAVS